MANRFKQFIGLLNGYRKYSVMILFIVIGVVFRVTDLINGAEFVDLLKGTGIAFMAFNGIEHTSKAVIEWVKKKF